MPDALTSFLEFFGIDAAAVPAPMLLVICFLLLVLALGVMSDIFSYFFQRRR